MGIAQSYAILMGNIWVWSIPINTIFSGMNIHLPAILMFTTKNGVQGFDTLPYDSKLHVVWDSLFSDTHRCW